MDIRLQELKSGGDVFEILNDWVAIYESGAEALIRGGLERLQVALTVASSIQESPAANTKHVLRELHALGAVGKANEGISLIAAHLRTVRPSVSRTLKAAAKKKLAAIRDDGSFVITPAGVAYAILRHPATLTGSTLTVDVRDAKCDAACWLLAAINGEADLLSGRILTPCEIEILERLRHKSAVMNSQNLVKNTARIVDEAGRDGAQQLHRSTVPKLAKRLKLRHEKGGYSLPHAPLADFSQE